MFTDGDSRDDRESLTQRALRLEGRSMVTISAEYGSFPYRSVTVVAGSAPAM